MTTMNIHDVTEVTLADPVEMGNAGECPQPFWTRKIRVEHGNGEFFELTMFGPTRNDVLQVSEREAAMVEV